MEKFTLVCEVREDNGLRISSPEIIGLILSDADAQTALNKVFPAIAALRFRESTGADLEWPTMQNRSMTPNTEIHSLLQDLAALGEEQNLGPVMVERVKRARDEIDTDEDMAAIGRDLMISLKVFSEALVGWHPCNSPAEIVGDLIYERDDIRDHACSLFDAIQHGDEVHKAWLKEAIENHFAGKPVPPPRAKTPALARVGDDASDTNTYDDAAGNYITRCDDGSLDDITFSDVTMFRMERMSGWNFWMRLYRKNGDDIVFTWDSVGGTLNGSFEIDESEALASIPTPTGRAEALEEAEKVLQEHARSYGAIDTGRTTDQRSRDYACEKALLTAAEAIRALSSAPTHQAGLEVLSSTHDLTDVGFVPKIIVGDAPTLQAVTVDDAEANKGFGFRLALEVVKRFPLPVSSWNPASFQTDLIAILEKMAAAFPQRREE